MRVSNTYSQIMCPGWQIHNIVLRHQLLVCLGQGMPAVVESLEVIASFISLYKGSLAEDSQVGHSREVGCFSEGSE